MVAINRIILIGSLLIHVQPFIYNYWLVDIIRIETSVSLTTTKALMLLTYPLCGWITEIFSQHKLIIKCSFIMSLIGSVFLLFGTLMFAFSFGFLTIVGLVIAMFMNLAGLAMFESNAIQFGMDQMLDASSDQLSSFIHWYFWCSHVGQLLVYYGCVTVIAYSRDCKIHLDDYRHNFNFHSGLSLVLLSGLQTTATIIGLVASNGIKQHNQSSRNPIKLIYKVLKYSYQHKYPERRSAFTYWENDIPSRIDLGKDKYGGPFTYEQVEDVKTLFRLSLLILSTFGFHILGEGYSLTYHIMNTYGCPSAVPFYAVIANPTQFTLIVVLIGIPAVQVVKKYFSFFHSHSLTKLWFGLLLSAAIEALHPLYALLLEQKAFYFHCHEAGIHSGYNRTLLQKCFLANINTVTNTTCSHFCHDPTISTEQYKIYLAMIPLILYGLTYLLIFMTTLEFISAQSPNSMKGLLIGIWYSTQSIRCLVADILDKNPAWLDTQPWTIYHGIKGVGIILSLLLYSLLYKCYHYRERNETINEQYMIEQQYEEELRRNESEDSSSSTEY